MSDRNPVPTRVLTLKEESHAWWCTDPPDSSKDSLSSPMIFYGDALSPPKGSGRCFSVSRQTLWKPRYKPPSTGEGGALRKPPNLMKCRLRLRKSLSVPWRGGGWIVSIENHFRTLDRSEFNEVRKDHQTHAGMLCLEERNPRVMAEGRCLPETRQPQTCAQKGRSEHGGAFNNHKGITTHKNPRKEKLCYQSIQIQQQRMQRLT